MAHLYLMRHARAADGGNDFLRPLTEDGRAQAVAQGKKLPSTIDLALVSGASRAQETADGVAQSVTFAHREDIKDLYSAGVGEIYELVSGQDAETILVIGHEPIISQAAAVFAANDQRVHEARGGVSPSTIIDLQIEKADFELGTASIHEIHRG